MYRAFVVSPQSSPDLIAQNGAGDGQLAVSSRVGHEPPLNGIRLAGTATDGYEAGCSLTSAVSRATESLASPKSISVLSS